LFCGSGGGDIVKAINRALKARGEERAMESYSLHGQEATARIVGRVIDKRLTDELGERLGLVIDGVDGRVHYVALGAPGMAAAGEEATIGSIVEIAPTPTGPRPADRNIARLARETGDYRPSIHRAMAESAGVRVPGGDYGAYAESHVRRLEALRRAGIVERVDADHWRIPGDFETRAGDYDAQRRGRMTLRLLSNIGRRGRPGDAAAQRSARRQRPRLACGERRYPCAQRPRRANGAAGD
jgi:hypothetical protein